MKTDRATTPTTQLRTLHARIAAIRRKRSTVKIAMGIALALSVLVGVFTVESILDWLVDLPWIARALVFVGCLGSAYFLLWRETIKPLRTRLTDDETALLIEHGVPAFRTKFIASIQLARDASAQTSFFIRALLAQTAHQAGLLDFRNVVKTAKLKRCLKACAIILALAWVLTWFGGESSRLLIKRAMLCNVPLPKKTRFLSITGDKKIGFGEDFNVKVAAGGVIPLHGTVVATSESGQAREFVLTPDAKDPSVFNTVIRSPQESFHYLVKLGDATSQSFKVQAFKRPTVAEVACEQTYPDYIGLPPVHREVNDLTLLAGSKLKVTIKASMNIGSATLSLEGLNKELPLKVDRKDPSVLHGELPIPPKDLTGFSVHLVSADGVQSGEGAVYRIDLVPDHEPTVKVTVPTRREELATVQAALRIGFEGKDDYGIAQALIHYNIDQGTERTIDFELGPQAKKEVTRQFEWKVGSIQPKVVVGSIVEFWITVADRNKITGPGVGTTEHYQIKIVSLDDKRLDLANRFRETMGSVSEITATQEELNKNLGEPLFEKQKLTP